MFCFLQNLQLRKNIIVKSLTKNGQKQTNVPVPEKTPRRTAKKHLKNRIVKSTPEV